MDVIIIQARMGSSRLPGKVLREINGVPLLKIQYDRVVRSSVKKIIIATTPEERDQPILDFCQRYNIPCFLGDENDVLKRYYECAKEYNAKTVIRLTSDCPLVSPKTIDDVLNLFKSGDFDYAANTVPVETSSFPNGSDVEVFSIEALERANKEASSTSDREHVTFYFWQNPDKFKTTQLKNDQDFSKFRYTVDYPEDLKVVEFILNELKKNGSEGTVEEMVRLLKSNEEIAKLNSFHDFKEGW